MAGCIAGILLMVGSLKAAPETTTGTPAQAPAVAPQPASPAEKAGGGTSKIEGFLGGRFPVGFYFQFGWKQDTNAVAHDMDDTVLEISKRGFNYLYVRGASDSPHWQRLLELCVQYRIAVIPQMDFAYLGGPHDDVAALAARAIPFIKKFKDHPAVVAFSVREEPGVQDMPALKHYYEAILKEVPDAPLHLLFSIMPSLKKLEAPYPRIIGTDRYPFWWEFGSGGHRATPSYALDWFHGEMNAYAREAQARGAEFQAVFTANTLEFLYTEAQVRKAFYPAMPEAERDRYLRSFKENASKKNLGLGEAHDGLYRWWKYYRPPANCTRAMTWISVQQGARSILVWHWGLLRENMKHFAHRTSGQTGREYVCSITGWDDKGTPQLDELTETVRELQRYAGLIRVMTRELGTAGEPEKPVLGTSAENLFQQSFTVPGYTGKAVVLVNAAVGSWCEGTSPNNLSAKSLYRIDDEGNAVDYKPFTEVREVTACVSSDKLECMDLETGKTVPMDADGFIKLFIRPGGGRFFFVCPKVGTEWARFKQEFRL